MPRQSAWSDAAIARLPVPIKGQKDHPDHGAGYVTGLRVRIGDGGKRAWVIAYRPGGTGNTTRRTIGEFPILNLEQARAEAVRWLRIAKSGADPTATIKAERDRQHLNNLRAAAEKFNTEHLSQLRTGKAVWSKLEAVVVKPLGARPVDTIARAELASIIGMVREESGPIAANRLTSHIKKMFRWFAEQGLIDSSPAEYLTKPHKREVARDRVLSDAEIKALWKATAAKSIFHSAIRLMLVTACRRNEAGEARQSEIANGVWTIPPERKNTQAHTLPLPALALRVLADAPTVGNKFIFSTTADTGISGWGKTKRRIDEAMLVALREDDPKAKLEPWRLHDLRRTAATVMANCGVLPHVIEMVLNHVSGFRAGVAGVYNRAAYLAEMRDALQKLSEQVERVTM